MAKLRVLKIEKIGEIISERELIFLHNNGHRERAFLRIGRPFEYSEELDWCCPYEIGTSNDKKLFGMIGIDSLQALELTMKTLGTEIAYWERTRKGKFHFLDEEGAGF